FFMVVGSGSRRVRWLCLRQATFSAKPPPPSQISAAPAYTTFDNNSLNVWRKAKLAHPMNSA
ncbi:hypothetical protein V4C53_46445, partial [Paraburkholderia azotifigens]|uniref:hypothetical protein n=1 Tax=Paraburkholderia azotifigens TaxID=2057004 RepID=UPI00317B0B4A